MLDINKLYVSASKDWGFFRRFIARHPLTSFWLGVTVGFVIGAVLL